MRTVVQGCGLCLSGNAAQGPSRPHTGNGSASLGLAWQKGLAQPREGVAKTAHVHPFCFFLAHLLSSLPIVLFPENRTIILSSQALHLWILEKSISLR